MVPGEFFLPIDQESGYIANCFDLVLLPPPGTTKSCTKTNCWWKILLRLGSADFTSKLAEQLAVSASQPVPQPVQPARPDLQLISGPVLWPHHDFLTGMPLKGTDFFSFQTGNKSIPQSKCNLTYIPGLFSGIEFFIPNRNIFLEKKLSQTFSSFSRCGA